MTTVLATYPNVETAADSTAALTGQHPGVRLVALTRANGRTLPPTPGLRWVQAGEGDGVQDSTETSTAGALVGVFIVGLLVSIPAGISLARQWLGAESAGVLPLWSLPLAAKVALMAAGAAVGALVGRKQGLPRDIAYRYSLQLRRGRVVVGAKVPESAAPALAATWLAAGASDIRITRGRLRVRPGASPDSLDLPAAARR